MAKAFDNNGQISVWEKTAKSGLVYLSGSVEIDGVVYNVSLFENERTSEKQPIYKGKVEVREAK